MFPDATSWMGGPVRDLCGRHPRRPRPLRWLANHQTGTLRVAASSARTPPAGRVIVVATELLLFFALFFAVTFLWPTWRLWRRERVSALVLPYDDTVHGVVGKWFRATLIGILVVLAALAAGLPLDVLGRLPWLESPLTRLIGWALLAASLIWVIIAQAQMGSSWRVGIDTVSRPPLVSGGVFARSRKPIFLGMRESLLGLFLVLPNALTLSIMSSAKPSCRSRFGSKRLI